jgi:UDP-N-acetylglucosamine--N-acetylmuramyl-(pentapeptide) pyrophosphoryl-undecaprenol N-acetylglucosamine transferase
VIEEESLTGSVLSDAIRTVYADRETYRKAMAESGQMDSIGTILSLIEAERK